MPDDKPKKKRSIRVSPAENGFTLYVYTEDEYTPPSIGGDATKRYVFRTMQDLIIKIREILED